MSDRHYAERPCPAGAKLRRDEIPEEQWSATGLHDLTCAKCRAKVHGSGIAWALLANRDRDAGIYDPVEALAEQLWVSSVRAEAEAEEDAKSADVTRAVVEAVRSRSRGIAKYRAQARELLGRT